MASFSGQRSCSLYNHQMHNFFTPCHLHVELYYCVCRVFQYPCHLLTILYRTILDQNDDTTDAELVLAALTTANTRFNAHTRRLHIGKNKNNNLTILPPSPILSPLSPSCCSVPQSPLTLDSPLLQTNPVSRQNETFLWCFLLPTMTYLCSLAFKRLVLKA